MSVSYLAGPAGGGVVGAGVPGVPALRGSAGLVPGFRWCGLGQDGPAGGGGGTSTGAPRCEIRRSTPVRGPAGVGMVCGPSRGWGPGPGAIFQPPQSPAGGFLGPGYLVGPAGLIAAHPWGPLWLWRAYHLGRGGAGVHRTQGRGCVLSPTADSDCCGGENWRLGILLISRRRVRLVVAGPDVFVWV